MILQRIQGVEEGGTVGAQGFPREFPERLEEARQTDWGDGVLLERETAFQEEGTAHAKA